MIRWLETKMQNSPIIFRNFAQIYKANYEIWLDSKYSNALTELTYEGHNGWILQRVQPTQQLKVREEEGGGEGRGGGGKVGTLTHPFTHHHTIIINRWHPADGTGTVLGAVGGHRGDKPASWTEKWICGTKKNLQRHQEHKRAVGPALYAEK